MEVSSPSSTGPARLQPRILALLAVLAAAVGFAAFHGRDAGQSDSEELRALSLQAAAAVAPAGNSKPVEEPRTAEDYIRVSRLIAYDVATAAHMVEHDARGDLFDCYVSMFLPSGVKASDLEAIRKAIELLDDVPPQSRDYRYHIKMTYCEFYRFVMIPVLHQRESGERDLPAPRLKEAGESFDAALLHAGKAGDALSTVRVQLRTMSAFVQTQPGKYDPVKLNDYLRRKQPLIRQIL